MVRSTQKRVFPAPSAAATVAITSMQPSTGKSLLALVSASKKKSSFKKRATKPTQRVSQLTSQSRTRQQGSHALSRRSFSTKQLSFSGKLYRNKPKQNYVNKSSHVGAASLETTNQTALSSNNKRNKRSERRKQLKQLIETSTNWVMTHKNELVDDTNTNTSSTASQATESDVASLKDMSGLKASLDVAENEIICQRKRDSKQSSAKQIVQDADSITALFKSDMFDSDPLLFTKDALCKRNEALSMRSPMEQKRLAKQRKKNTGKQGHKRKKKGGMFGVPDADLKRQLAAQIGLMRTKKLKHKKDGNVMANNGKRMVTGVSGKAGADRKLSGGAKRVNKMDAIAKGKPGIEKKLRKKMTAMAKRNQKKRKWRI